MKAIAPLLVLAAMLASCAAPQRPAPAPQPQPPVVSQPRPVATAVPLPPAPADWRDAPQTGGVWTWSRLDSRSIAAFGASRTNPVMMLTCDRTNNRVEIARATDPLRPAPASALRLLTTSQVRPLSNDPALSTGGWLVVPLSPRDPLLDAMAFSRGRFALESEGHETLYLPSSPELSRVIEDCR